MEDGVFRVREGDTLPALRLILRDEDGLPVELAEDDVVEFRMTPESPGAAPDLADDAVVNVAEGGDVQYEWGEGAPVAALYRAEFRVTFDGGATESFPLGEYLSVEVLPPALA